MPLKLVPPRPEKGRPNFNIRGTYLGTSVYQTTGTSERRVAQKELDKVQDDIERGRYKAPGRADFVKAALAYVEAGGEKVFLQKLKDHFGATPLDEIDQAAIDAAASALYPDSPAPSLNRRVHTPVSAILKHAGIETELKRPKGWRGTSRLCWLTPPSAFALLASAAAQDARFGALCTFLLYTGCRLSEALGLQMAQVDIANGFVFLPKTKNRKPRSVHLPPIVVAALANLGRKTGSVFRYSKCGRIYTLLAECAADAEVDIPDRVAFHIFRHTYGAWMRRHAGLDTSGLVATGAWKSHDAARVYEHVEASEEARKADLLPTPPAPNDGAKVVQIDPKRSQVTDIA